MLGIIDNLLQWFLGRRLAVLVDFDGEQSITVARPEVCLPGDPLVLIGHRYGIPIRLLHNREVRARPGKLSYVVSWFPYSDRARHVFNPHQASGSTLEPVPAPPDDNVVDRLIREYQREPHNTIWYDTLTEIGRLQTDCAEAYQVIGAALLGESVSWTPDDVARALDNLNAAANGMPRPHEDLLPWPKPKSILPEPGQTTQ